MRICVYCASSNDCDAIYHQQARYLGELLAKAGCTVVYGGGAVGSMGALADGVLAHNGKIIGVIPAFMVKVEWQHPGVGDMQIVNDMRERKHRLLTDSDAVIALPGGSGTLEELFEAITLKRLGIYHNAIVIINTNGYYDALLKFLSQAIDEKFMDARQASLWTVVDSAEHALALIQNNSRELDGLS